MKKTALFAILLLCFGLNAQELPYAKMLSLTPDQLKEGKFKYDSNRNQYVLKKTNGLNAVSNWASALNGQSADVKPHPNDYCVIIQNAEEGVASVEVVFYKDDTYHELALWANDNGQNLAETNSGKLDKMIFEFDGYNIILAKHTVGVNTTTRNTSARAKTIDESYNEYTYTILTGKEPYSPWHQKEAEKQAKRDAKGRKKSDISDLM